MLMMKVSGHALSRRRPPQVPDPLEEHGVRPGLAIIIIIIIRISIMIMHITSNIIMCNCMINHHNIIVIIIMIICSFIINHHNIVIIIRIADGHLARQT